jgi:hypothetical protein
MCSDGPNKFKWFSFFLFLANHTQITMAGKHRSRGRRAAEWHKRGKEGRFNMRKAILIVGIIALLATALPTWAELQQVQVGGELRLRYDLIMNTFTTFAGGAPTPQVRWGKGVLGKRAIGGPFNPVVASYFDWDNAGKDVSFVEQRTRLNVKADFTDNVSAFIELDSYDTWGEDFRSANYVTGLDTRAASGDDVEIYQAYIDAKDLYGTPLSLRIGRQEMAFGSQWLVGTNDFAFFFTGLSFDAIRATYATDTFTVDAWASKVAERMGDFMNDDADFYGIYASCKAIEGHTFDAYWMWLRDDADIVDVPGNALFVWEKWTGVDNYGTTNLHTAGLRAAGAFGAFDYDAEVAYQFGSADTAGATFKPVLYGDDDAKYDNLGAKLDAGYRFDCKFSPRVFVGGRYYGGEDNRDISFWNSLNLFHTPEASISFNRLFSNDITSGFFDHTKDLSNAYVLRAGVDAAITEKLLADFCVSYFHVVDTFDRPAMPWATMFPWVTKENDGYLGTELRLFMEYHYSQDLTFEWGWAHLFTGDGLEQGSFIRGNGLIFVGGTDKDDADYIYGGCKVKF